MKKNVSKKRNVKADEIPDGVLVILMLILMFGTVFGGYFNFFILGDHPDFPFLSSAFFSYAHSHLGMLLACFLISLAGSFVFVSYMSRPDIVKGLVGLGLLGLGGYIGYKITEKAVKGGVKAAKGVSDALPDAAKTALAIGVGTRIAAPGAAKIIKEVKKNKSEE